MDIIIINDEYTPYFKQLENDGYCVIPDVFSVKKCDHYISKIWDWLENIGTGIDRNDKTTWTTNKWPLNIHGIIDYPSAAHEQFVWNIRMEPVIHDIFSQLWEDSDLLCSFDRICVMKTNHKLSHTKKWIHTDQSSEKKGKHCIQGFINLETTESQDGCLQLYPGSHKLHERFYEEHKIKTKIDWYKLEDDHYKWFEKQGMSLKRITAPQGSLVLWDSRTFHSNAPPLSSSTRNRYVVYVCMLPRERSSKSDLKKKREAFEQLRATNHWPNIAKKFPKIPRTYGRDISEFKTQTNPPILNDHGKRLAGY